LLVQTVIVFQGPGSWMREAHWDEYVVTLANRSPTPMTIKGAWLTGIATKGVAAGTEPWALERVSLRVKAAGVPVGERITKEFLESLRDPSTYVPNLAVFPVIAGVGLAGAISGGAVMAAGSAPVLAGATVLADPKIYANIEARSKIVQEFQRRRLALPVDIAPGQSAQGSLFFPFTPGPQSLVLYVSLDGAMHETILPLRQLAGLHLPPAPTTSSVPPTTTPPTVGP
jgi:hypothetical protein